MEQFIGCDAHKKFSVFAAINERGEYGSATRVGHEREVFRTYLKQLPPDSHIALETSGFYYWMVDEMEQAGHVPRLAPARTAKRRMEARHKTNARDAQGLADAVAQRDLAAGLDSVGRDARGAGIVALADVSVADELRGAS